MSLILHITDRVSWQQAEQLGVYQADSLRSEGFIHCSTPAQVVQTANRYFRGQSGLVLLCIDSDRAQAEIRYEGVAGGEQFPHLYGPLNLDAVLQVLDFEPGLEGLFELPAAIAEQLS